jgi:hypothetical protein
METYRSVKVKLHAFLITVLDAAVGTILCFHPFSSHSTAVAIEGWLGRRASEEGTAGAGNTV